MSHHPHRDSALLPATLLVMGVSASGKTGISRRIAKRLDRAWLDADDLHPKSNIEKMAAGFPLTDEDRWPWLDAVADWIRTQRESGRRCVVACSALKRAYRDRLRRADPDLLLIFLKRERAELEQRIREREGHFMPPSQLDDQLATLEPPQADEAVCVVTPEVKAKDTAKGVIKALRKQARHTKVPAGEE
jgi:gluconokinase